MLLEFIFVYLCLVYVHFKYYLSIITIVYLILVQTSQTSTTMILMTKRKNN